MTVGPWFCLAAALPVLLLGEALTRRLRVLARFNIPVPVVGGLVVSLLLLVVNASGIAHLELSLAVDARWWNILVLPEPLLLQTPAPAKSVYLPFMIAFFTCVGLNAEWGLVKRGGWPLILFLGLATLLAAVQVVVGVGVALGIGAHPLLGLVCGPISMTGGHGTAGAFAPEAGVLGLANATTIGLAAATFGLLAGGLLGGPIGGWLLRSHHADEQTPVDARDETQNTFIGQLRALGSDGAPLAHMFLVLFCMKVGAWLGYAIESVEVAGRPLKFPVYIGAMIVGIILRNASAHLPVPQPRSDTISRLMFVSLGIFLAVSMSSMNLLQLADVALPMLVILAAQVLGVGAFAVWVTYPLMGRGRDGAVIASGHCGFGLGATPNAVANMESLVMRFGPSPKAFLIVPIVGAFLLDFTNALVITLALNLWRA